MFTLFKKELSSFFSSLIGYLTIIVFLILTGLMLWVFKSDFNILDYSFAGMDGLFVVGPFLYLFLIPAITMRMFAEEKKNGTMELLLTKPLSEMKLIWAKFLAGWCLSRCCRRWCATSVWWHWATLWAISTQAVWWARISAC